MRIAIVGKYVELHDAYLSIKEALIHASVFHGARLDLEWIHSEHLEDRPPEEVIGEVDGIVLCPGFGDRGLEGKIEAVRYARERRIPFLGVCLGPADDGLRVRPQRRRHAPPRTPPRSTPRRRSR